MKKTKPGGTKKNKKKQRNPNLVKVSSMYKVDNLEYYPNLNKPPTERSWKAWHEREIPVRIHATNTTKGVKIKISSKPLSTEFEVKYPNSIWEKYPKENKIKLLDNIAYIFTAHLPLYLKGNIRLEYNTGYPQCFSWAQHCFMKHLPLYWYYYKSRGTGVFPLLKTLLNSRAYFSDTKDVPPEFPATDDNNIILPFTFGKDSFLSYHVIKELGLNPILIFFDNPDDSDFEGKHKKILFKEFVKKTKDQYHFFENPIEQIRDQEPQGCYGWELLLTSWTILSLPFAYKHEAGYLVFSNEKSVNAFFYDESGFKVVPEYEQAYQATEELSLMTQALSEGEVYTTTFLQGLNDIAIVGILKYRYPETTLKYLMSCWSGAEDKRWCGNCSKCARLYLYLSAFGVDPIKEAGFEDNLFLKSHQNLYNVFGKKASGTGWDSFGLNTYEQALAFYICTLRGQKDPLVKKFKKTQLYKYVKENLAELVDEYLSLHEEHTTPVIWEKQINKIYNSTLREIKKDIIKLESK